MAREQEFANPNLIYVVVPQGSTLMIALMDNDGEFGFSFTDEKVEIVASMPDTDGREGVIYSERFAETHEAYKKELAANGEILDGGIDGPYNERAADYHPEQVDDPNLPSFEEFSKQDGRS